MASSPGHDNIHSVYVKLVPHHIAMPLSQIINLMFNVGIFRTRLKAPKIIPVFKSGHRSSIANYRPAAILQIFGKIKEKCIKKHLKKYFSKVNILSHN